MTPEQAEAKARADVIAVVRRDHDYFDGDEHFGDARKAWRDLDAALDRYSAIVRARTGHDVFHHEEGEGCYAENLACYWRDDERAAIAAIEAEGEHRG